MKFLKLKIFLFFAQLIIVNVRADTSFSPPCERVMTIGEFERAIDNYEFFKETKKTTKGQPLDKHELKMIEASISEEGKSYGGIFDPGREINGFTGQTLVVGGGKLKGVYGENQGKTVLFDFSNDEKEVSDLIVNLQSGEWGSDPYTGISFKSRSEKAVYIEELKRKQELYRKAFGKKNKDILERYYTLNIDKDVKPDIVASIISESDMSKIPDNKFMRVEFENVPCQIFLDPKLYKILDRITKPGGKIELTVTNACRRLIAPVIQNTKFSTEYEKLLRANYELLETLHPTYHRLSFEVTNY